MGAEPGEGLGQGREVIDLPEAEGPALESVAEFLGHAIDVSMQEIEERSVHILQGGGASCARAGGTTQRVGEGVQ
jgi:hypothetical protein